MTNESDSHIDLKLMHTAGATSGMYNRSEQSD